MTAVELEGLWDRLSKDGWSSGHLNVGLLYPMPGDRRFDEDDLFRTQPLFPGGISGTIVHVRDAVWEMPQAWFREMETRPLSYLRQRFQLDVQGADPGLADRAVLVAKRCVYLEMFRSRRPVSLSTLRTRRRIYMAFAQHAVAIGKDLTRFEYIDIANVIGSLNASDRTSLPAVYELLRWWQASAPDHYGMFTPPPSLGAVSEADDDDNETAGHAGLDTGRIRGDVDDDESKPFQPFPDGFVAAAGEFCLSVLDELRPAVLACFKQLMAIPEVDREDAIISVIESIEWPLGIEVANSRDLRAAANLCQIATIFVLSLVLGPRWSEVSALPRKAVRPRTVNGTVMHFLDGSTFKLSESTSGDSRDWPLNDRVAAYLEAQREYIELVEGPEFKTLWRSHKTVWGGAQPQRQIDGTLKKFARKFGFEPLLADSSCHHHRFRKTTARLIVIALHGGPVILRRLFGHEHLAMTLRYILANQSIIDELRAIAEEEQRRVAATFVERRDELRGGGADTFRQSIAAIEQSIEVYVPEGRRDQEQVTTADILEIAADGPEGLMLKQIVPGLVACFKPREEAGICCKAGELPNVAKCDAECNWHLEMPEFLDQARINVADALTHLAGVEPGTLTWRHYAGVVRTKVADFPELVDEHSENPLFRKVMEVVGGYAR